MPLFSPDELKILFRIFAPSELDKKGFFYVGLVLSGQRKESSEDVPQSALYIIDKLKEKGLIRIMKKENKVTYKCPIDLEEFLSFARRSYDSKSRLILWSLFYSKKDFITFRTLAKISGLDETSTRKTSRNLEKSYKKENILIMRGNGCEIKNKKIIYSIMWRLDPSYDKRRPRMEEYVFRIIDREEEIYGKEIYDRVSVVHEISKSAMYKAINKLELQEFIFLESRKSGQGAPRDYVSVNCNKCFLGYSSKEKCWNESMNDLIYLVNEIFKTDIDTKNLNKDLKKAFDGKPQLLHKLIYYLAHLQQLNLQETIGREQLYYGLENIVKRINIQDHFKTINSGTKTISIKKQEHIPLSQSDLPLWLLLGRIIGI